MREIKEDTTYRHFKGNVYRVLHIAYDAEHDVNGEMEKMVVYKSNHDGKILVRSYENFASKVDREKYPNADQEYRFEEVD
jgi:hypothetical protein